jgi:hypothetical protein
LSRLKLRGWMGQFLHLHRHQYTTEMAFPGNQRGSKNWPHSHKQIRRLQPVNRLNLRNKTPSK